MMFADDFVLVVLILKVVEMAVARKPEGWELFFQST
jgi:hypothetical protein